MRRILKVLIPLLLFALFLQFQSQALSPRDTILQLLKDYSPTGYHIVNQYEQTPEAVEFKYMKWKTKKDDFMEFVKGNTVEDLLAAINIVVHETCHTYSALLAYQLSEERFGKASSGYNAYYTGNNTHILVKKTPVYNTGEMAASIPDHLRTFRFKLYVSPESDDGSKLIGSKHFGIYGLLNEFNAYYHGNKAALDLYPYYRDKMKPGPAKWHDFFSAVNRSFAANVEFKFFIVKYLQYAKTKYPEIYQGIIRNKDFCAAFWTIEKDHADLIKKYFQIKQEIVESLSKEGYTFSEDENFMYIGKPPHRGAGTSHHLEPFYLLKKELEKEEYQMILKEIEGLSPRETILQLLKEYSPTGYYIVDQYERAPVEVEFKDWKWKLKKIDFMEFVQGDTIENLLSAINTVVHETCHSYTLVKSYQLCKERYGKAVPGHDAYYVGNDTNILVKKTKIFNTEEIASSIPESLRTFRFKTYVSSESARNIGSKIDGVYGLLDEYNAYYHGNKAAFDLFPYYRDQMRESPSKWHKYFYGVNGSFAANMEFKFYIVKYLQYAKTNYPAIYRGIIRNKDFCAAFRAIEKNHAELVKDYFKVKQEIYEILRNEGYTVSEDDKFFYIGKEHSRTGTGHLLESFYLLQKELEKEEYQQILDELKAAL